MPTLATDRRRHTIVGPADQSAVDRQVGGGGGVTGLEASPPLAMRVGDLGGADAVEQFLRVAVRQVQYFQSSGQLALPDQRIEDGRA